MEKDKSRTIEDLISATNHRAAFINQVEHAKRQYETRIQFAWDGHYFTLDHSFVMYVGIKFAEWSMVLKEHGTQLPFIVLDNSKEPVLVEDVPRFVDAITEVEQEALNDYFDKYQKLKEAKTVEELYEVA